MKKQMTHAFALPEPAIGERPAPLWPWLLTCALAAACIDLGSFHELLNADAIIPVLSSLYRWTPFYWGANRFGLLLPLAAMPCSHPLANLLVQSGLSIGAGLAVLFLFPRHLQRDAHWPYTGAGLAVLFLLLAPERFRFMFLTSAQSWSPSLALSLAGMILLEDHSGRTGARLRFAAALLLVVLGHWVNPMPACVLIPLVLLRRLWARQIQRGECAAIVIALALAFLASVSASLAVRYFDLFPHEDATRFGLGEVRQWPVTAWKLAVGLVRATGWFLPAFIAASSIATFVAWREARWWPALRRPRSVVAPALVAAAIYAVFTTSLAWVELNQNSEVYRFWLPAFFTAVAGVACSFWPPMWRAMSHAGAARVLGRRAIRWSLPVMVVSAAVVAYGIPSLSRVRRDVDARCGRLTNDLRDAGCTHVVGSYWTVWPAMFHANLVAHERGESEFVWGEAFRAGPLRPLWHDVPLGEIKLAIAVGDSEVDVESPIFDLAAMSRVRQGAIDVLTPRDLFLMWTDGFLRFEGRETDRQARPSAKMWLCNRSAAPHSVDLELNLCRQTQRDFPLSIETEWFSDRLDLEFKPVAWKRTIVVPPGRHLIALESQNPRFRTRRLALQYAYRVIGPRLINLQESAEMEEGDRTRR